MQSSQKFVRYCIYTLKHLSLVLHYFSHLSLSLRFYKKWYPQFSECCLCHLSRLVLSHSSSVFIVGMFFSSWEGTCRALAMAWKDALTHPQSTSGSYWHFISVINLPLTHCSCGNLPPAQTLDGSAARISMQDFFRI